jgi:hypothetical protein
MNVQWQEGVVRNDCEFGTIRKNHEAYKTRRVSGNVRQRGSAICETKNGPHMTRMNADFRGENTDLICDDPRTKSACRQACGQFFESASLVV